MSDGFTDCRKISLNFKHSRAGEGLVKIKIIQKVKTKAPSGGGHMLTSESDAKKGVKGFMQLG